ncbi:hypothetical protein M409DRAFT_67812 [Zasmidium cellare ATCC 36951]|uniref:Uncharacterized protein n=1 Tax=Zasmidium cellare ATCC 36951 TaxID=1080233 RepID=A0A6A6CCF3_ZASCE|nr:uncharacterized protein M409DRAFT_67812 [Zasmidium cellare ATCC 36951]KAF2164711.1 hypothetical protein M409DRAFT_67812 [Zasmidium cellare ATCC 36951]
MLIGEHDTVDVLLKEERLKQISRSIRSFVPSGSPTEDFKTLLARAFYTSSALNLSVTHRVAAWNTLCSLIDQSLESTVPVIREAAWKDGAWERAFDLYLNHAQGARPKSSRQLLATLTNALKKSEGQDLSSVKINAAQKLVSALFNYDDAFSAKVGAQLLSHMLVKDVLSNDDVLRIFRRIYSSSQSGSESENFLLVLFKWLRFGDFGSTIAHLVSIFLDKLDIPTGAAPGPPIWIDPLQHAFVRGSVNIDDLRAHVLPIVFKRNFNDFASFLYSQGVHDSVFPNVNERSNATNDELLYVALQTGKELGLLEETDESSISRHDNSLRVPVGYIGNLLFHSSRSARVTGLYLLVTSHAATRPFSRKALRLIRKALDVVFADVDADFRGDVFSTFQKLIDRFRSITATLARQAITISGHHETEVTNRKQMTEQRLSDHRNFLKWLLDFLCWQLRPTASYQRHISALKCLSTLTRSGLDESIAEEYYSKSALSGTRWPFQMQVITVEMQRPLLDLVLDPFDDVRQTASSILGLACTASDNKLHHSLTSFLERAEEMMLATGRADHADGVAHVYALQHRAVKDSSAQTSQQTISQHLLDRLEQTLAVARGSLAQAVAKYPMHGLLTSIRYVVNQSQGTASIPSPRLCDDLQQIWEVVKPVLCDDAPEGYVPDEVVEGLDSTKETLSYCWRAFKEASLLMSSVVASRKVDEHELQQISNLCFTQLAELRHRGAFSTVAQTWMTCCMQCKDLKSPMGIPMLVDWYTRVLGMLRKNVTINTRRSAGIPSLLCGILIADRSGKLLSNAVTDLETIARQPVDAASAEEGSLPQVHAMNCLKDMLKNSRLGEQSEKYVPRALQLAADALRSDVWAVRNCGLMLFRAVIDRLLGTDQSPFGDDDASQKLISIHQHPQLIDVILDLLSNSNQAQTGLSTGFEGVFPALQLLQHVQVPLYRLDVAKRAVESLTASASWHIRDKAARSLAALMAREEPLEALNNVQTFIIDNVASQNALRGALLTAQHFITRLRRAAQRSSETTSPTNGLALDDIRSLREEFMVQISSLAQQSGCPVTRAAAIDVVRAFAELSSSVGLEDLDLQTGELIQAISADDFDHASQAVLRQAMARLMALRISCGEETSLDDGQVELIRWALRLAQTDQNACEHFLRSLNPLQPASHGPAVSRIHSLCAEIIRSDLGIHLKCEAQRLLLTLTPNDWSSLTRMSSKSIDPRPYLSEHDCNQRYADQWLQIRAIEIDNSAGNLPEGEKDVLADIVSFVDDCVAAVNGHGVHMREAAASAIDRLHHLWIMLSRSAIFHDQLARLCIGVYDLLNDDDEDTRLRAAAVTKRILAAGSSGKVLDLEPITASRQLLAFSVDRWPSSWILAHTGFKRAFGTSDTASRSVAEQLAALSHGDTALFVEEKQNLYIDEASEIRVWTRVLSKLAEIAISRRLLENLGSWVLAGLRTLAQYADTHPDGALGWSSKPDVSKLVLQVVYGAEMLLDVVERGIRLPVRPSEIRRELFECAIAFEKADVVCLLRWEVERVLSESVVHKVALVHERMALWGRHVARG